MKWVLLTFLLLACGETNSSLKEYSSYFLVQEQPDKIEYYSSYFNGYSCPEKNPDQFAIYFNEQEEALEKVKITSDIYDQSLVNKIYYHTEIDFIDEQIDHEGHELDLCLGHVAPRKSIEQIAINTLDNIKNANDFMFEVDGNYKSTPINILIHPKQKTFLKRDESESFVTDYYKWETDNISYNYYEGDVISGSSINIYPRSNKVIEDSKNTKTRSPFSGKALWSFPYVLMHEYGHHLLSTYIWRGSHLDNSHQHFTVIGHSTRAENKTLDRRGKYKRVNRLISELYADLFAYYSLPRKYTQFKNSLCLSNDRDLESTEFYAGKGEVFKVLNRNRLNIFKTIGAQSFKPPCNLVFTDVYKVGAIFSHFIFSVNNTLKLSKMNSMKAINKTFQYLGQQSIGLVGLAKDGQIEKYLIQFIKLYLVIVGDIIELNAAPYPRAICTLVEEKLPAIFEEVIDSKKRSCRLKKNPRS